MSQPPVTPPRHTSPIDQRMATLAAQRAADDAAIPRSPPPPSHFNGVTISPLDLRIFLLAKRRFDAERKA